ncbi:MAG: hypothetical protein ACR2RB_13750 [Gammaproteobacteria bacterium]
MTATFRVPLTVDILGAAPGAPAATKVKLYMKADGLYALDAAATEVKIGPSGAEVVQTITAAYTLIDATYDDYTLLVDSSGGDVDLELDDITGLPANFRVRVIKTEAANVVNITETNSGFVTLEGPIVLQEIGDSVEVLSDLPRDEWHVVEDHRDVSLEAHRFATQGAAPLPSAVGGEFKLYTKTDGLYSLSSAGTEAKIGPLFSLYRNLIGSLAPHRELVLDCVGQTIQLQRYVFLQIGSVTDRNDLTDSASTLTFDTTPLGDAGYELILASDGAALHRLMVREVGTLNYTPAQDLVTYPYEAIISHFNKFAGAIMSFRQDGKSIFLHNFDVALNAQTNADVYTDFLWPRCPTVIYVKSAQAILQLNGLNPGGFYRVDVRPKVAAGTNVTPRRLNWDFTGVGAGDAIGIPVSVPVLDLPIAQFACNAVVAQATVLLTGYELH